MLLRKNKFIYVFLIALSFMSCDKDRVFEETISEMLHKLDPHSNYIASKDMAAVNESIEGEFGGIGVRFLLLRDTICITNIIGGSPSEMAGVKAGDKIIEIEGKSVVGKKITNEKKNIRRSYSFSKFCS